MHKKKHILLVGFIIGFILTSVLGGVVVLMDCHFSSDTGNEEPMEEIEITVDEQQNTEYRETEQTNTEQINTEETNVDAEMEIIVQPEDSVEEDFEQTSIMALQNIEMYTYKDLKNDSTALKREFSNWITVDSLGTTADGRSIYHFIIGNPNAGHKIFINAGIHGREYMSCLLVMKQMAVYLQHIENQDEYNGMDYQTMWDTCAIHVVPMINPDGVTISQFGIDGLNTQDAKHKVKEIALREASLEDDYYFTRWKANANGVDLNRNFDALWDQYDDGVGQPSADHHKGTAPGCEVESAALIDLTEKEMFDVTISYHTQGSVIYWYFGQEDDLYEDTKSIADRISDITGYPTDANYEYLDPAGYKDWGISKMGIPGLTVEIGSGTSPVPSEQFSDIWNRNQFVWETLVDWVIAHE